MKQYSFRVTHQDLKSPVRGVVNAGSVKEALGKICIRVSMLTNTDKSKLSAPTSLTILKN
jgi:hypothetical protein